MESIVHMSVTWKLLYYIAENVVDLEIGLSPALSQSLHTWMCMRQVAVHEHCSQTVSDRFAWAYTTGMMISYSFFFFWPLPCVITPAFPLPHFQRPLEIPRACVQLQTDSPEDSIACIGYRRSQTDSPYAWHSKNNNNTFSTSLTSACANRPSQNCSTRIQVCHANYLCARQTFFPIQFQDIGNDLGGLEAIVRGPRHNSLVFMSIFLFSYRVAQ